jgi:hypothetical protein
LNGGAPATATFVRALREPSEESRQALRAALADEVEVFASFGVGSGPAAVDAVLDHPLVQRLLDSGTWSEPVADGGLVAVTVTAPPAAAVGGFRFAVRVDPQGRIDRVEQDLLPAPPLAPAPVALTDAHAELLAGALANGTPVVVGYVDADGVPHLSYRATAQVIGPDRLGMWIREPGGGLARALATNPNLSFFYSDRAAGVTLQISGRGWTEDDPAVRDAVYDASPKPERNMDWRMGGIAVVVDVDKVEGRDAGGRVLMTRAADSGA